MAVAHRLHERGQRGRYLAEGLLGDVLELFRQAAAHQRPAVHGERADLLVRAEHAGGPKLHPEEIGDDVVQLRAV